MPKHVKTKHKVSGSRVLNVTELVRDELCNKGIILNKEIVSKFVKKRITGTASPTAYVKDKDLAKRLATLLARDFKKK